MDNKTKTNTDLAKNSIKSNNRASKSNSTNTYDENKNKGMRLKVFGWDLTNICKDITYETYKIQSSISPLSKDELKNLDNESINTSLFIKTNSLHDFVNDLKQKDNKIKFIEKTIIDILNMLLYNENTIICLQQVPYNILNTIEKIFMETHDIVNHKHNAYLHKIKSNKIVPDETNIKFLVTITTKNFTPEKVKYRYYKSSAGVLELSYDNLYIYNCYLPFKKDCKRVIDNLLEDSLKKNIILIGNSRVINTGLIDSIKKNIDYPDKINFIDLQDYVDHNKYDMDTHKYTNNLLFYGNFDHSQDDIDIVNFEDYPNEFITSTIIDITTASKISDCSRQLYWCSLRNAQKSKPFIVPVIRLFIDI
jgi:hypothetical protein